MSKTDEIFKLTAPYNNPYQGTTTKLLFVCSAGILRSATAANLFAKKGYNTRNCGTHEYALIPLSANLIYWADQIFFMSIRNHGLANLNFIEYPDLIKMLKEKSVCLDIPDEFAYNDPELIKLLEERVCPKPLKNGGVD